MATLPGGRADPAESVAHDPASALTVPGPVGAMEEVERRHIQAVLVQTNWMIEGERGAAKILNVNPSTLRSRMKGPRH